MYLEALLKSQLVVVAKLQKRVSRAEPEFHLQGWGAPQCRVSQTVGCIVSICNEFSSVAHSSILPSEKEWNSMQYTKYITYTKSKLLETFASICLYIS